MALASLPACTDEAPADPTILALIDPISGASQTFDTPLPTDGRFQFAAVEGSTLAIVVSDVMHRWDRDTNTWSTGTPPPIEINEDAVTASVAGATCLGTAPWGRTQPFACYHVADDRWSHHDQPDRAGELLALGGKIYGVQPWELFAGFAIDPQADGQELIEPIDGGQLPHVCAPSGPALGAAAGAGYLWFCGVLLELSPPSSEWSVLAGPDPSPGYDHPIYDGVHAELNGKLCAVGWTSEQTVGPIYNTYFGATGCFDPSEVSWSGHETLAGVRPMELSHALKRSHTVIDDVLYAPFETEDDEQDVVHRFDEAAGTWELVLSASLGTLQHTAALNGSIVAVLSAEGRAPAFDVHIGE